MADLPAKATTGQNLNDNKQDNKFDKLTPILEYTYIVIYNMLNTLRSMKNYVDIYAQDMRLTDLEQYDKASVTLDKAIEDLTKAGKSIGSIYGLPEEMLDPQKMAEELARQMKNMPQSTPNQQVNTTQQSQITPQPPTPPTPPTQQPHIAPEPHATAPTPPTPPVPPAGPNAQTPSAPGATPPTPPPAAPTPNDKPKGTNTPSSDDNEEIQKILEQLKALRQNQ